MCITFLWILRKLVGTSNNSFLSVDSGPLPSPCETMPHVTFGAESFGKSWRGAQYQTNISLQNIEIIMRSSHYHGLSWYIITHFIMSTLQYSQLLRDNSDGKSDWHRLSSGPIVTFFVDSKHVSHIQTVHLWSPDCQINDFEDGIILYHDITYNLYIYYIWDHQMGLSNVWTTLIIKNVIKTMTVNVSYLPMFHPPNPVSRGCQLWQYQITTCARATNCFILQIYMEHGIGGGV